MADAKITKVNEPLPAGKIILDDKGALIGMAIEDSTPNGDGTHSVRVVAKGVFGPIHTHNVSPVYLDYKRPAWYVRLWRWLRRRR